MYNEWIALIKRANQAFTQDPLFPPVRHTDPSGRLILTCMDDRINLHAIGIAAPLPNGTSTDRVPVIRTAGARLEAASLFVAALIADVKEILVLGHTQCGVQQLHTAMPDLFEDWSKNHTPTELSMLRSDYGASANELMEWVQTFADVKESVVEEVRKIKDLPFSRKVTVHGAVYDVDTGEVEIVVDGSGT